MASAIVDKHPESRACGSRTITDDPSATSAIGDGSSYSKRILPGFWI